MPGAICRAVQEPGMRFVRLAHEEQQAVQACHRVRSRFIDNRTALVNQIRGILLEYGVAVPQGVGSIRKALPALLAEERWSALMRQFLTEQQGELLYWDTKIEAVTKQIKQASATQPVCPPAGASARDWPPWGPRASGSKPRGSPIRTGDTWRRPLGLVPTHTGTGGKVRLGGISKRGDRYLRRLLIHGARAVVAQVGGKTGSPQPVAPQSRGAAGDE